MGAALVAYVDRNRRSIELDPAVRPGARLTTDREALLLHTTGLGHCGEAADVLASALRDVGWRVKIKPVDDVAPLRNVSYNAMLEALAGDLTATIGAPTPGRRGIQPTPPRLTPAQAQSIGGERFLCMTCGHVTTAQRHVDSHIRNLQHTDVRRVPTVDIPALQAQIVRTRAQAGAPEDQEALPEPPGQQVHGYTHPSDSAAVTALPDQDQP